MMLCAGSIQASTTRVDFNVAKQSADKALVDFARQAGLSVLFPTERINQVESNPLRGKYDVDQALAILLRDTGLTAELSATGVLTVKTTGQRENWGMQSTKGKKRLRALISLFAGALFGQSRAETASSMPPSDDMLQEVIVSAQKREERLQDVPVSVSVLNPETLLQQNNLGATSYLPQAPGVALDQVGAGQDQLTIRGIATGLGTNPLVGITIDDIPFGSSVYASLGCCILPELDPLLLDSIEVLRGPQGTLYGANAMGGLVKFVTSSPSMSESAGRAEVDTSTVAHGNQGYGVRVAYSTPLVSNRFALQMNAFDRQDPGYIRDPLQGRSNVNEAHVSGGRIALDGKLTDFLTLKVSALYQQTKTDGSNMVDIALSGAPLYGPYEHERMPGTDGLDEHLQFYSANLTATLGAVSLSSLTGYQRLFFSNPTDDTPTIGPLLPLFYPGITDFGVAFLNVIHTDRLTQEFRIASAGQTRLQYIAGLFYSNERNRIDQQLAPATYATGQLMPSLPSLLIANVQQNYTQYAAFANVTFNLTDRFDIGAGGRFSHNEQNLVEMQSGTLAGGTGTSVSNSTDTETPTTYSFTGRYHIDPAEMIYASIASGFRAGGPNINYPPGHRSFDPDTTINYEVGLKSEWLNNRVTVNPALYYIDWSKIQVFETTPNGLTYFTNGGRASSKGLEVSLEVVPVNGLHVTGNVSYDDAKLTENAPQNTFYGFAGDQLPFAAEWTAYIAADYVRPITDTISVFSGLSAIYTGARLIDFAPVAGVPRLPLPAFTTLDLRFGAKFERLRATLFVRNVGDKRGFVGGTDFTAGTTNSPKGPWEAALITPRTIGISLSTEF